MDNLIQDLQKTIEALEALSEQPTIDSAEIDEWLDPLFQQKIDLVHAALNVASQPYQQAAVAMRQAAAQTGRAAKDPARLAEATQSVADATAKLAKLLDSVSPLA